MSAQFDYRIGREGNSFPCRWIDGSVIIHSDRYELVADLCGRFGPDLFMVNRFAIEDASRFTAEGFLAILGRIAKGPFEPTETGLEIRANRKCGTASAQIARLLEPAVRSSYAHYELAPDLESRLEDQLLGLCRQRRLQLAFAAIDWPAAQKAPR